jgi:hypothetical protein
MTLGVVVDELVFVFVCMLDQQKQVIHAFTWYIWLLPTNVGIVHFEGRCT